MGKMKITGLTEYETQLKALGESGEAIAKMALYDGAAVVVAAVASAVQTLPVVEDKYMVAAKGEKYNVITEKGKADLIGGLGIAKMRVEADVNTIIGFNGYSSKVTKKYPDGVPNAMIARAIESGSSVRAKHPFFRIAVRKAKAAATAAIEDTAQKAIQKVMSGK